MSKQLYKILVAATGSVASIKIPILLRSLLDVSLENNPYFFEVRLTVTKCAKHFFKISDLPNEVMVFDDELQWSSWHQRGDPVRHVELNKVSDILVIAPLNANTMAKIANGICDNALTSTIRAWDHKKPVIFCPAMNVTMWAHPLTAKHVGILKKWGFIEVPPISKTLMCTTVGKGAMAEVDTIIEMIMKVVDTRLKQG